jgi:aminoglycoside phosphotransferase (APT) family kinase protein
VGDILTLDGRYGLVYEHIAGPSMERVLEAEPQRLDELARALAQLHAAMHHHTSGELPPQRYLLEHHIDQAAPVPMDGTLKQKARRVLDTLPDGSQLCHGDFHPGNVLMAPGRPTAIDWENAALGSPLADVARTLLLLETAHLHFSREQQDGDLSAGIIRFKEQYLQEYISLTRADAALIAAWRLPVAAARLHEGIAEEESYLLDPVAGQP